MSSDFVTIVTGETEAMAALTQQRLEAAGIPAIIVPGDASSYLGASTPTEVRVPGDRLADAEEVLRD